MNTSSVLRVTESELTLAQAEEISAQIAIPAWADRRDVDGVTADEPGWIIDMGEIHVADDIEAKVERYTRLTSDHRIEEVGPVTVRFDWADTPASMEELAVNEGFDVKLQDIPSLVAALKSAHAALAFAMEAAR